MTGRGVLLVRGYDVRRILAVLIGAAAKRRELGLSGPVESGETRLRGGAGRGGGVLRGERTAHAAEADLLVFFLLAAEEELVAHAAFDLREGAGTRTVGIRRFAHDAPVRLLTEEARGRGGWRKRGWGRAPYRSGRAVRTVRDARARDEEGRKTVEFREGVARATVIRSNPRGFREKADVSSRSAARTGRPRRRPRALRGTRRGDERSERVLGCIVGVVEDDGRAGNAPARRGTCSRAGAP